MKPVILTFFLISLILFLIGKFKKKQEGFYGDFYNNLAYYFSIIFFILGLSMSFVSLLINLD